MRFQTPVSRPVHKVVRVCVGSSDQQVLRHAHTARNLPIEPMSLHLKVDQQLHSLAFLSRSAFPTTEIDDSAIAAAAIAGESSRPSEG